MRSATGIARRLAFMGLVVMALMAMGMSPATAREICNQNESLRLADGNGDGVVSRGEIQTIINAAQGVEGVDQLQSLLNGLPGDVTGIRYVNCSASGDDSGTGGDDAGSGGDDTGTGTDGSGSGTGTGTDGSGSGTGTDGGTGTGDDGTGTDTGTSGADASAGESGTGEDGTVVINAEGTPINTVTGLPDTGQMPAAQAPGMVSGWLLLGIVGAVAGAGALVLRSRSHAR